MKPFFSWTYKKQFFEKTEVWKYNQDLFMLKWKTVSERFPSLPKKGISSQITEKVNITKEFYIFELV